MIPTSEPSYRNIIKRGWADTVAQACGRIYRSARQTELATVPDARRLRVDRQQAAVAAKHYLPVTDEHFTQAAQITAQLTAATSGNRWKQNTANHRIPIGIEGSKSVQAFKWAALDSNQRLPPCEAT